MLNAVSRAKWDAWKARSGMAAGAAMTAYVRQVELLKGGTVADQPGAAAAGGSAQSVQAANGAEKPWCTTQACLCVQSEPI